MLKDHLNDAGVDYEEKLVDQDDDAKKKMLEISGGFLGVPFTVIEKDDETHTVIGFDKNKINEILNVL